MNKNVHDTDDFFKDAYQHFEETPSTDVWEKINAHLDKKDSDANRKKIFLWRRATIFLLLLLIGFILLDFHVFNIYAPVSKNSIKIIKGSANPVTSTKQGKGNSDLQNSEEKNTVPGGSAIRTPNRDQGNPFYSVPPNNEPEEKYFSNKKALKIVSLPVNESLTISSSDAGPEYQTNGPQKIIEVTIPEKIIGVPFIEKYNVVNPYTASLLLARNSTIPVIDNTGPTKNPAKTTRRQNKHSFIPYWLMSAYMSYDHAGYKLDSDLPANINTIERMESHEPSFSVNVVATKQLSNHWGIQTGLVYSNTSIGISPQKLYALKGPGGDIAFKYTTSSGYAYIKPGLGMRPALGDSLHTVEGNHKLQFLRVPLIIKYELEKNKLIIAPGAGLEANFLTSAKVETEIEHPVNTEIIFINKLDGARKFHVSVVADAELRYQLNKKSSVNIRPVFRYALSPITKDNVVETFPYSFGLGVGMTYRF